MKKKVLYVFVLVLYLLIACTLVSQKIEIEMCTQVEVSQRNFTGYVGGEFSASADALFVDGEGRHLYEVTEGTGWTKGLCVKEIPTMVWRMNGTGKVTIPNGRSYSIVESASRMPVEGEPVVVVKVPGRTKDYVPFTDQYLVCYAESVPSDFVLPEHSKIVAQSDTELLLDMADIIFPFFEHRAKPLSDSLESEECRVFSMTEVENFLEQLPRVAVLSVYLFLPIGLWLCSGIVIKEPAKYKDILWINTGITMFFLAGAVVMLGRIDLPASLLPASNIFDVSHYEQEFQMIMEAQRSLKMEGQMIEVLLSEVKKVVACILGIGMFAGFILSAMELFISTRIRCKKLHKHNN